MGPVSFYSGLQTYHPVSVSNGRSSSDIIGEERILDDASFCKPKLI